VVSVAVHAAVVVTLLLVFSSRQEHKEPVVTRLTPDHLVWVPDPRPPARGGGGQPAPTKPPEAPKPTAPVPEPVPAPPIVEPQVIAPAPEPEPQTTVAAVPSPGPTADNAASHDGGIGDKGRGTGAGPDDGPGGGGTIYGIGGNGVSAPIPLRRPPPAYTAEAMRARLQGVVVLNCVVRPDGKCSDIRVTKSLDSVLGLDQQAIASAREWQFRPGMRMGQPVPVLVTLEIGFTIR
jgi:protein TonB